MRVCRTVRPKVRRSEGTHRRLAVDSRVVYWIYPAAMELVADYFAALGRGVWRILVWVGWLLGRFLAVLVWAGLLAGVVIALGRSLILGVTLGVLFLLGSGFVLFVLVQRDRERSERERSEQRAANVNVVSAQGDGIGTFIRKVLIALIIVFLFLKYFVQIRLVPQVGH